MQNNSEGRIGKLGLHCESIELGEVEIKEDISKKQHDQLNIALKKVGLELLDDNKSIGVYEHPPVYKQSSKTKPFISKGYRL